MIDAEEQLRKRRTEREKVLRIVLKQERLASEDPRAYRRRVQFLVFLGYAYPLAVLALCAGLIGLEFFLGFHYRFFRGLVQIQGFLAAVCVGILRSIFLKTAHPDGIEVSSVQAPELRRQVDELAATLGAPAVRKIYIDSKMNAGALEWPRFGALGGYEYELVVGLPLLFACSIEEARAVIAHELGHFSGQNGRLAGRVRALCVTFENLRIVFTARRLHFAFAPFYNWFSPIFEAVSFVMRRSSEYEADAAAARVTGTDTIARFLLKSSFLEAHLKRSFTRPLQRKAQVHAEPPEDYFESLQLALALGHDEARVRNALTGALKQGTTYDDTHPCLADRLTALGSFPADIRTIAAELSVPPQQSAARALLEPGLSEIVRELGKVEAKRAAPKWRARHAAYLKQQEILRRADESASFDERHELALANYSLGKEGEAEQIFEKLYSEKPDDPKTLLWLGTIRLKKGHPEALEMLRLARQLDPDLAVLSLESESNYYRRTGDNGASITLGQKLREARYVKALLDRERGSYNPKDELRASSLPSCEKEAMARSLKGRDKLTSAYVVDKVICADGPKVQPCLVVVANLGPFADSKQYKQYQDDLISERIITSKVMIYVPREPGPWKRKLKRISGAKIL